MLKPRDERNFWLRRLHSLAGIIPIGGFLAFHLYENYSALKGAEHYNEVARKLQVMPLSLALEIAVIGVPIFFHGIYGLFITATARRTASPTVRNWMYTLQRVSGVILFAYILFHLWTTRFVHVAHHEDVGSLRAGRGRRSRIRWIIAFYDPRNPVGDVPPRQRHLVLLRSSGDSPYRPRAQRCMEYVSVAVFLVLSFIGMRAIFAFV